MANLARIDERIAAQHLLRHPFYLAWTAGTLPRESLLEYARQYFAFESNLPRYLTALHARSENPRVRAALLANAWDEEHGERNHAELWLRFAAALGLSRREVENATRSDATRSLVDTYWAAASEAPVLAGVAALYAYESQLPAVSESKMAGLERHYGVAGEAVTFFSVHRAIDVHHAAEEREILEDARADDEATLEWTARALDAWWNFLSSFPMPLPPSRPEASRAERSAASSRAKGRSLPEDGPPQRRVRLAPRPRES
jgi:pyrroloquinoline-quinone synthase